MKLTVKLRNQTNGDISDWKYVIKIEVTIPPLPPPISSAASPKSQIFSHAARAVIVIGVSHHLPLPLSPHHINA